LLVCVIAALLAVLLGVALERSPIKHAMAVEIATHQLSNRTDVDRSLREHTRQMHCGVGPESFVELQAFNDSIFTGTSDGRLVQLRRTDAANDLCRDMRTVLRVGHALADNATRFDFDALCGDPKFERVCGRLLGLRPHPDFDDVILALDASFGLLFIHVPTASVRVLANHDPAVPKDTFLFSNDLVVVNRFVYFTVSSARFERPLVMLEILEASCTGRLMRLALGPNTVTTLASNLCFPNGIEQRDATSIIFSETTRARLMRFDIPSGTVRKFADLPGLPDNIRRSRFFPDEFWIAYGTQLDKFAPLIFGWPSVRRLVVGVLALFGSAEHPDAIFRLLPTKPKSLIERRSLIDGQLTARFCDEDAATSAGVPLAFLSEVHELEQDASALTLTLLIGSYRNDFVILKERI
jgi:hypothetical protein